MKKFIIIAAALLCLASCAKVEKQQIADNSAVSFKVLNYAIQTKAEAFTGEDFGVYAFWTATDWATDGDANVFMNNDRVVQSPEYAPAGEWGPEQPRFWTKTGKITFAAYAPYSNGGDHGFSTKPYFSKADGGFYFQAFTIPANTDVDLMVADLTPDQTRNDPEYMLSGNKDGVPVLFRHVLSKIAFKFVTSANNNPNVETTEIVIHSVVIKNIKETGTYKQGNTPVWDDINGNASYEYNPATGSDITVKPGDEGQGTSVESRILMPQTLVAGSQQITISYTIRTKFASNPEWAEENITATVDLVTDEVPSWNPNMSLVYTLNISPVSTNPILFDPAVAEWLEASADITVN